MVVISAVVAVVVVAIVAGFCYRWLVLRSPVVCFYYFCAVGVVVDVIMDTVVVALITSLRHGERSTILHTCVILCYSFRLHNIAVVNLVCHGNVSPMLHVI